MSPLEAFQPISLATMKVLDRYFPEETEPAGFGTPWSKTAAVRFLPAELSLWTGINGHGKSLFLNQMMLEAVAQGEKVFVASFEMTADRNGQRLVRQALGRSPSGIDEVIGCLSWLGKSMFCNSFTGRMDYLTLLKHMEHFALKEGVTQFVIDSLMKCGIAQDDFKAITDFIDRLQGFAQDNRVHVHLVAHARKQQDEMDTPGKMDVKGPVEITNMPDNVFSVWRNKALEQNIRTKCHYEAVFECVKSRESGSEVEKAYGLFYHKDAMQYLEGRNDRPKRYYHHDGF